MVIVMSKQISSWISFDSKFVFKQTFQLVYLWKVHGRTENDLKRILMLKSHVMGCASSVRRRVWYNYLHEITEPKNDWESDYSFTDCKCGSKKINDSKLVRTISTIGEKWNS